MPRTLTIVDVDQMRLHDLHGDRVQFVVEDQPRQFRRWRPAVVRGDCSRHFLDAYFRDVAPMPWAGLIILEDADVTTEGLILQEDRLYVGPSLMYPMSVFPYPHSRLSCERQSNDSYLLDDKRETISLAGTTANIVCDGWQIYGHWLVDVLPRLYRVMNSGMAIDTYLLPGPARDWQIKMLDAVGLDLDRCRFVDLEVVQVHCEHLVVPTYDRFNSEIRPTMLGVHEKLRRSLCGDAPVTGDRDLFVSRNTWGGSRQLNNRVEVEAACSDMGFEIVRPELLSFTAQVQLFASARSIVGECGSGLHNAVFSGPNTKLGLMQCAGNYNFLQSQIGLVLDHELFYVLGPGETKSADTSFSVNLQDARYVAGIIKG